MRLFKLVYYGHGDEVESDLYVRRENAIQGALKYIRTKMGLASYEVEIEDEVRFVGSRINFYETKNIGGNKGNRFACDKINSVHIEVVSTEDD